MITNQHVNIDLPKAVWMGMSLNWNSGYMPIAIYVELPFWLMTNEARHKVKYRDTTLSIDILNSCIEHASSAIHLHHKARTIHITHNKESLPDHLEDRLRKSKEGRSFRFCKTVLAIHSDMLSDVSLAMNEKQRRHVDALHYLRTLAYWHMPFLNKLINCYRRTTYDPYAYEVTEASVPFWFFCINGSYHRVSISTYSDNITPPTVRKGLNSSPEQIVLATSSDIQLALSDEGTPGEIELLDAWSMFYGGRHSDSIRSFVTAIEILLDYKLYECYKSLGLSMNVINKQLESLYNDFDAKFNAYLKLSKRTPNGPLLHILPHINGIYVRSEHEKTRKLRHKIVHEGFRFLPDNTGTIQRSAETTTWLFDWLEDNNAKKRRRWHMYTFKFSMYARPAYAVEYTLNGVRLIEESSVKNEMGKPTEELMTTTFLLSKQYQELNINDRIDYILLVKMSLHALLTIDKTDFGYTCKSRNFIYYDVELLDLPLDQLSERLIIEYKDHAIYIFIFVEGNIIDNMQKAARRIENIGKISSKKLQALIVLPTSKHKYNSSSDHVNDLHQCAIANNLCVLYADELRRYITAATKYKWTNKNTQLLFDNSGFVKLFPDGYEYIGKITHYFSGLKCISIELCEHGELRQSDKILIINKSNYCQDFIQSMQVAGKNATTASHCKVGVITNLTRPEALLNSDVYRAIGKP